ncbi:alpha/beta hydrolase [Leptolyngbya sp. AN02str]|uniref:alpha/beta hydrolase n=1 Tax=Leptolyngbya sp. AN02str TaxID=3423363 RepID=UPI003D31172F
MRQLGIALSSLLAAGFVGAVGLTAEVVAPRPAHSAERLTTFVGPLQLSVSIDELETFAETGQASGTLGLVLRSLNEPTQLRFRQGLQRSLKVNAETMARITYIPMVEQVIQSLGNAFTMPSGRNGFSALRSALILTAANKPDGWTAIDVMRQFPAEEIRLNIGYLRAVARELSTTLVSRDVAIDLILQEAQREAANEPAIDYAQLPDLSEPGPHGYTRDRFTFDIQATRATLQGLANRYPLRVDAYVPEGVSGPVPVVVFSHGFGGRLTDGQTVAEHLTSHGFAVLVPEHVGTTDTFRSGFLQGRSGDIMSPIEYASRQLDIIYMLDEFEQLAASDPDWANRLDLQNVGVMGASFGGLTSVTAAGASFSPSRLAPQCSQGLTQFNPAFLLQCHARFLPPTDYNFADPRIKAAFPQYPMGATLFGPSGMGDIQIPMLILAGSHDLLAPAVYEQIPMFSWLRSPHKYLALMVPGTHFSTSSPSNVAMIPPPLRGPDATIGRRYQRALSVAFFKTYLSGNSETSEYLPYLTSSYAQAISQPEMPIYVIQSLTPEQLAPAYGGIPPGAEQMQAEAIAQRPDRVLDDIQQTGLLRVGIRTDAAPLGYIDAEGRWAGYCFDLANQLASELARSLPASSDRPLGVDVIRLPSSSENPFELVQSGAVHMECGPNSIQTGATTVTFSEPFMVTGTQFLVTDAARSRINLSDLANGLAGVKTGVPERSRVEELVRDRYPRSTVVPFAGEGVTQNGVQAVTDGTIDTFANDGLLLLGELARQDAAAQTLTLVPSQPLSCDFYGLVLPSGDSAWRNTVNRFLRSETALDTRREWLSNFSGDALTTLDFCFR